MGSSNWRRLRSAALVAAALAAACNDSTAPAPPNPGPSSGDTARVVVHPDAPGARIPPDFLGLGFEMPVVRDPRFSGDPVFERLLTNLGPGVLRFGGNSVEATTWSPTPVPELPGMVVLTPADFDRIFAFAGRTGWRVMVDMRLGHFEPDTAAAEAEMLRSRGGSALLAVEIGNEPDVYPRNGLRETSWGPDSLAHDLDTYIRRIRGRASAVPIAAPATTCEANGQLFFATALAAVHGELALATHHFYPMARPASLGSPEYATIDNMLSPALMARTAACIGGAARTARAYGLPLRLAETNSASGFGKSSVSDVLASALWGVDHFFTAAEQGAVGVNVETGTDLQGGLTCAGVYLPVCGGGGTAWTARPLYYAMLLVHQAARGRAVPTDAHTSFNVVSHATLDDDGTVRVVLINKEAARSVQVHLDPGRMFASASALRLAGRAIDQQDGVTFGGGAVAPDGSWAPGPPETVTPEGAGFTVSLAPASAALIVLQPGGMVARSGG